MTTTAIGQLRSCNRVVTERVGALNDHFLACDRPFGEGRLLWEVGETGCAVCDLRSRLNLDAGYASRRLRSVEAAGPIRSALGEDDCRVRFAQLTAAAWQAASGESPRMS
jgi:hypothetical protein